MPIRPPLLRASAGSAKAAAGENAHEQLSRAVSIQAERCHTPYVDGARGTERGELLHYRAVRHPSRLVVPGETPHEAPHRYPGLSVDLLSAPLMIPLVVLGRNNPAPYTVNGRPLYVHLNGLAIVLLK
jgi:hypothetical protein